MNFFKILIINFYKDSMDIDSMIKEGLRIRDKYDDWAKKNNVREWGLLERTTGLVTDVGELTEYVMVHMGYRSGESNQEKLKHEICDCIWALICIADYVNVDIKNEFSNLIKELDARLDK